MRTTAESEKSQALTQAQREFVDDVRDMIPAGQGPLLARRFQRQAFPGSRYLLDRVPSSIVVAKSGCDFTYVTRYVEWLDTKTGNSGVGAFDLARYVWRTTELETAKRIYTFLRIVDRDYQDRRPLSDFETELAA